MESQASRCVRTRSTRRAMAWALFASSLRIGRVLVVHTGDLRGALPMNRQRFCRVRKESDCFGARHRPVEA